MRGETVGERLAALQHAQDVEDDEAELRPFREFASDGQRAIDGHARVEQRRELLREEQDVAPVAARECRKLQLE